VATYITNPNLSTAVAAANTQGSAASLPAQWNSIVPSANIFAYNRIRSVLFNRGFTPAQVDAWDERESWNEQVGVCVAFWRASKSDEDRGEPFRREFEALMEELKEMAIVIDGVIVNPTGSGTRISFGDFDTTSDIHTMEDTL
jgi:hypothetical protein